MFSVRRFLSNMGMIFFSFLVDLARLLAGACVVDARVRFVLGDTFGNFSAGGSSSSSSFTGAGAVEVEACARTSAPRPTSLWLITHHIRRRCRRRCSSLHRLGPRLRRPSCRAFRAHLT